MQRLEIKMFIDVDDNIDLAEFENVFYRFDSLGKFNVDVARVDIIDTKEV